AHDDIYGELFRDLDKMKPGDEAVLYTATQKFYYRVVTVQLVEPTDVSIMGPTVRPTLTLISCYPYMVDNQRIVVTAELAP
ncbi:MAG TPA: sortase, partial [Anaerolineales bacterium]